jgi:hypothetical protein
VSYPGYITIPERLVKDKPLSDGFVWYLKEDDTKFASIRKIEGDESSLVYGLERNRSDGIDILRRSEAGDNACIETLENSADAVKQAVNFMYAHFILGEQST